MGDIISVVYGDLWKSRLLANATLLGNSIAWSLSLVVTQCHLYWLNISMLAVQVIANSCCMCVCMHVCVSVVMSYESVHSIAF